MSINDSPAIASQSPAESIQMSRRRLLLGSAGAMASVSLLGLSPLAKAAEPKNAARTTFAGKTPMTVIVHSANTIETERGAIGSGVVTDSDKLYVRNNLPAPNADIVADRDAWKVTFEGVNGPQSLTLGDLKKIGVETVTTVLQCSGNGRAYYPARAGGHPVGAQVRPVA